MAKKRTNQPKPLSEQLHNAALDERLKFVEGFVRLAVTDLQKMTDHVNYLGSVLQATVNVLGQGAVTAELQRLANPNPPPAPPSEEEKANADQAEDRPAESP